MLKFDKIFDKSREKVAAQAASMLASFQGQGGAQLGGPGTKLILGVSLAEMMITPQWFQSGADGKPAEELIATGQTLSLIEPDSLGSGPGSAGKPIGYTLHEVVPTLGSSSTVSEDDDVRTTAVASSELGRRILETLTWIDDNAESEPLVRVLVAPAYLMTVLGLYYNDKLTKIVVVTPPAGKTELVTKKFYVLEEFRSLMKGHESAVGLTS